MAPLKKRYIFFGQSRDGMEKQHKFCFSFGVMDERVCDVSRGGETFPPTPTLQTFSFVRLNENGNRGKAFTRALARRCYMAAECGESFFPWGPLVRFSCKKGLLMLSLEYFSLYFGVYTL